jgi:hypothetical protein
MNRRQRMNRSSIRFTCSITLVAATALFGCSTPAKQQSANILLRGNGLDDARRYS